jgi:tetratricopeptide (TPR) repeat protein
MLGGVRLVSQGTDLTEKLGHKHLALLVYLFHEMRPMHPSEVIELLGRGQEEGKEIEGLTRAVTWLKNNVPGINVRMSGDTIEAIGGLTVDARDVDSAIDGGDPEAVLELYVGEFLEGFESGAPAFDEWAQKERGRIKRAWGHAMLSAARDAERTGRWTVAARWWEVLVTRAPMRPEAVAGLLNAYARSSQGPEAARAYAAYKARLKENGIAQPADAVKQVISEHKLLREAAEGRIQAAPERHLAQPVMPAPAAQVSPKPAEPLPSIEMETVAGLESGAPPLIREGAEAEKEPPAESPLGDEFIDLTPVEPPAKPAAAGAPGGRGTEEWEQIVDIASTADFDIPITKPKGGTAPGSRSRKRDVLDPDDPLHDAHAAAAAFEQEFKGVKHQVTSVRKAWTPYLVDAWEQLRPWRERAAELALAGLQALGQLLAELPGVLAALAKVAGGWGAAALQSLKGAARKLKRKPRKLETLLEASLDSEPFTVEPRATEPKVQAAFAVETREPVIEETPEPDVPDFLGTEPDFQDEPELKPAIPTFIDTPPPGTVFGDDIGLVADAEAAAFDAFGVEPSEPKAEKKKKRKKKKKKRERRAWAAPSIGIGPVLRRYWYAPVGVAAVGLLVAFGPRLVGMVGGLTSDLPSVEAPSLPKVSLPRVSVPKVTIRTPSFVETSVQRLGEILSGPLLDGSGQWLLIADAEVNEVDIGVSPQALALALEAELNQSYFLSVVPRERALAARRNAGANSSEQLSTAEAVALAKAEGYAAVITAAFTHSEGADSVTLRVLSPDGEELYGVAAELTGDMSGLETLLGLTRPVRRRLGEPTEEAEASLAATQVLSASPEALNAYAVARSQFFAGRYTQAVGAARQAVSHDSAFAMAHLLQAEAHANSGNRVRARAALERAYEFGDRASDRERLRILADRHAWEGRFADAALTYDSIFVAYRDDVGALKSQALMQVMIGTRGGGGGNLYVAYSIDQHDWPSLSRVARYLGYRGRLPDVDSLVSSLGNTH